MREDHPAAPGETKASSKGKVFSSIQGRLVSLLLLVLVPILLVQVYFNYDQYQSTKRVESEANLHLARATARAFDTFVQDVLHQELAIGLAFTSSQTLSEKEKNRILLDNQAGNPAIWHLFWTNPAGIVTSATGSQFIEMDLSDREFYREIVAGKDWVVSDLLLSKTTKQPSFTISRGIRNERGELLGMIVAGILPAKLDRVLAVERPGDAGVSLLDSKGMNVYRYPATQLSWEQRNWLKLYPIIGEVLKGKEVVTSLVSDRTGTNRIGAFTPIPSIGWIATCSRAEEVVVRPIISATLQETGITLLVAFVSLLTAFALSRTISTSVTILRNYALSLGQGETQNRLTISRPAEIKDLAEAFNKMSEEIRSREKALRESEQRYSALFANKINGMAHCCIITDEQGRPVDYIILQINEAYERIIGIKKADIEGRRVREVFPEIENYALDYIGIYGRIALDGSEIKFEEFFEATGQYLSIYAYSPLPGEFIAIFTDVTERKLAEELLRESEERYRSLVETALFAIFINRNNRIEYANPAAIKLFGVNSLDDLIGRSPYDFVHPEFHASMTQRIGILLHEGGVPLAETRIVQVNGDERFVEVNAVVFADPHGPAIQVMMHDITERKQALDALHESEEQFRILADAIPQLCWMANPDGWIFWYNQQWYKYTGTTAEQMEGWGWQSVHDPDVLPGVLQRWQASIASGEPFEMTFPLRGNDGTFRPFLTRVLPLKDSSGLVLRWFGTNTDISDLKRAEQELQNAKNNLELRVRARTEDLEATLDKLTREAAERKRAEGQLQQALAAAETVNNTMRRLMRTVAHEFRTPLGLLTGSVDILDRYWDRLTPEKRGEQNEQIRNAACQMSSLVNSVIAFNLTEPERLLKAPEVHDIDDLCRSIAAEVETVWCSGHEYTVAIDANCGAALFDGMLFRQILQNLLSNACRYTPADGAVSLQVQRRNSWLLLEVTDTGIGILEDERELIFDAFYRGQNVGGRRGLGLGLSIVRDALKQLGGTIMVTSVPGSGTSMRVDIPVADPG